jgi:SAM-dependent methyltransferase
MMPWLTAVIYDRFMRSAEEASLGPWRRELLAGVRGKVLEIGAGTGASLAFYPPDANVTRLVLAEPDPHMRARLEARLATRPDARVTISDADVERLPFDDGSFDAVVSMLVLCSVKDPGRAMAEVRRVLAPGGALVYLEHVAADDHPSRLAWQRRIEPVWKHVAGNCRLTRRTSAIIAAELDVENETRESARKMLPIVRTVVRGVARKVTR